MLHKVRPVYETLAGWQCEIDQVEHLRDLPANAREFVKFVEARAGVPVTFLGVGPGREQTVVLPAAA